MANTFNFGNGNWAQKTEKVLAYNAENNNYKPLPFDFDRASTATRVNKDGLIETVVIDEPRIDYTGNPKGHLLLEPSRRNLFTYSQDASQWGYSGIITPVSQDNSVNNPDGISGANEIIPTSASALKYFFPNNTYSHTSGDTYSFSVFAKANELKYIQITGNSNAFGSGQYANFDLENGVIGTYAGATSGTTPKIEDYGNGWYRCQFQVNASATTTQNIFLVAIVPSASASRLQALNPNGTDSLYVYGFQAELGSYATSYIPTSGQSGGVTRSAETCSGAGNSTVFNDSEGVLYVEALLKDTGTFKTAARITATDTSTSDGLWIYFRSDNKIQSVLRVGGVDQTSILSNTQTTNEYYKVAFKFKQNDFALWVNGTEVDTDTSGNTFSADTLSKLGFILSTDINPFIGNVKDVKVYNTALTDAELIALTS